MSKICSITVTYNRKELLKKNVEKLLNQTVKLDKIIIIDNFSSDGTKEYINDLVSNNKQVEYIRLSENLGGSAGFYEGIKRAYDDNMDFIWGMDDDAFPEADAIEELLKVYKDINKECCLWSNCNNDNSMEDIKKVQEWMFVGFFIPRTIIDKVGFPRNDFFIYHDDSEYSYRIIKSGYDIYKVKNSRVDHGDMSDRPSYKRVVFGKDICFPKMPDWKLYYFVRNHILKYSYLDINKYKQIFVNQPKNIIRLALLNKHQCKIYIKGYFHGIFGVTGKVMKP